MKIISRAPVRIDYGGGGTDCPPYSTDFGGAVFNAGISRYAYAVLEPGEKGDPVILRSLDLNLTVSAPSVEDLELNGQLDLIKSAVKRLDPGRGFRLTTETEVPPGSGLGASASLTVAVLGALAHWQGLSLSPSQIAELAFQVERIDLGYPGGKQDQYGAVLGGINYLEFKDPEVRWEKLPLDTPLAWQLEKNSLLVHTGAAHLSQNIHWEIRTSYADPQSETRDAMHQLKRIAQECREAYWKGDLHHFVYAMNENWVHHKRLHPSCTNPDFDRFFEVGLSAGATGAEACGAGGGGCIIFYCPGETKCLVRKALEAIGGVILDFVFDRVGLRVWEIKE